MKPIRILLHWSMIRILLLWGTLEAALGGGDLLSLGLSCEVLPPSDSTRRKIAEHFSLPETTHTSEVCLAVGPGCYQMRLDGTVWLPLSQTVLPPADDLIVEGNLYRCPKGTHHWKSGDTPAIDPGRYTLYIIVCVVVVGGALVLLYLAIMSPYTLARTWRDRIFERMWQQNFF